MVPEVVGEETKELGQLGVTAVVLTHRRPRLAGDAVRSLLSDEGFPPDKVIVVVNGTGGLDDPELEQTVHMVRLQTNVGPAGGFRTGLLRAFEDDHTQWAYLCEDDITLFGLPTPRVARLLCLLRNNVDLRGTGAVVAYGRRFVGRGHFVNVVPDTGDPPLVPVDVGAWGATLVNRAVIDSGVLPETEWFFGYEDFDFFCRVRAAGFGVFVDSISARAVEVAQTSSGRDAAVSHARPTDAEEPWRAYYVARNFFHLARAHGSPKWIAWHLVYSMRRIQRASSRSERLATLHGLIDGVRGRFGEHARYKRDTGEHANAFPTGGSSTE